MKPKGRLTWRSAVRWAPTTETADPTADAPRSVALVDEPLHEQKAQGGQGDGDPPLVTRGARCATVDGGAADRGQPRSVAGRDVRLLGVEEVDREADGPTAASAPDPRDSASGSRLDLRPRCQRAPG